MSGQIFISYRREESRWSARSLYDRLSARFDRKQIFMDIDAIALGDDFVKAIEKTVGECDVLIAVIGAHWLTSTDEQNGRRLDNPEDFVRREIATALKRDIRVIPVLVDGALMPRSTELPDDLKPLVRRNALRVSDTGFDDDCRRLVAAIEQVLAERPAGAPSTHPGKRKLGPVAGIMTLLAVVIGLVVGAAIYTRLQRQESKPTTPEVVAVPPTIAQQPSYEFRLRGGGFGSGQILTKRGSSSAFFRLVVSFKFGNAPAGEGLEPGQGSWLDRGMRPNEPTRIEGDVPKKLTTQLVQSLSNDPNAYWSFWIYNTNQGYFQITRPPAPFGNTKVPEVKVDDNQ